MAPFRGERAVFGDKKRKERKRQREDEDVSSFSAGKSKFFSSEQRLAFVWVSRRLQWAANTICNSCKAKQCG